ncbi:MAG: aminotransferase class V-fold PLP-dependent enzyme, partial [Pirellulaceae bacterium]
TPPIVPALGLASAITYLEQIGLERIHRFESLLVSRAHEVLAGFEQVRILGPSPASKAGIVSFVVQGIHAHDVAQIMDQYGIAIRAGHHCTMPLHKRLGVAASNRASFYFYNTLAEVEQLGGALEHAQRVFRRSGRRDGPRDRSR